MPIESKVEDVVCGMMVEPDSYRFRYQGRDYAFCSAQCGLTHPIQGDRM
jgi:YHS domain-containing protein